MVHLQTLNYLNSFHINLDYNNPGETYNGHLVACDGFMNLNLKEVICTTPDVEQFWRLPEVHLRGNAVKYLRIPDEVIDQVKEEKFSRHHNNNGRGGRGGRGGNRGGQRGGRGGQRQDRRPQQSEQS